MNSLLSGLTNTLARTTPAAAVQTPSVLLQAFGAYMRGEDASTFMKNLANTHPQLKALNLDDLPAAAQNVCAQNGVDPNTAAQQINQALGSKMF